LIELESRTKGCGIFSIAEYTDARAPADFPIHVASNVIVRSEGKAILLNDIQASGNGNYVGTVFAIEPPGTIIEGVSEGQRIPFREQNVFSMAK
jgi:hypothetical protein